MPDVCVIELGGTVGDIESMPFIEALRQLQFRVGPKNFVCIHVSLIPTVPPRASGAAFAEQKTKPTQHSVASLRALGLSPQLIVCRGSHTLQPGARSKLAMLCHVPDGNVIDLSDVANIWHVPYLLERQGVHGLLCSALDLGGSSAMDLTAWKSELAGRWDTLHAVDWKVPPVRIAIVGKYTRHADAYLSVIKALQHACLALGVGLNIRWIEASDVESAGCEMLAEAEAIVVPGGFGSRGWEGAILATEYSRTKRIPFLGICLGMQAAVVEFARNVCQQKHADSTEMANDTQDPMIVLMPEVSKTHKGGTMRLGLRQTILMPSCLTGRMYGCKTEINERHRHRYEVNPERVDLLEAAGLAFVGRDSTGTRMSVLELPSHPFFVGTQFHPEFRSRPFKPAPLFLGLVEAASHARTRE